MNPVFRIKPWAGGWGVFRDDENVAVEPFRTPADAVIHAKELARHVPGGAQLCIYNESGTLLSEFFFQGEERPALDRDETIPSLAASRPARTRASRSATPRARTHLHPRSS